MRRKFLLVVHMPDAGRTGRITELGAGEGTRVLEPSESGLNTSCVTLQKSLSLSKLVFVKKRDTDKPVHLLAQREWPEI